LADTQYRAVAWQADDLATVDKMQQSESNVDWIKDNTPRARYRAYNVQRWTGLRLLSGVAMIPSQSDANGAVDVNFGEFFTSDCQPVITNGVITENRRVIVTLTGLGKLIPDERGFHIFVQNTNPDPKKNKLDSKTYVPWQAMGY